MRGRNGVLAERSEELRQDRQGGMLIRDIVGKYGVSRGYVITLLRRLRAEYESGGA